MSEASSSQYLDDIGQLTYEESTLSPIDAGFSPVGSKGQEKEVEQNIEIDSSPLSTVQSTGLTLSSIDKVTVNVRNLSLTVAPTDPASLLGRLLKVKSALGGGSKSEEDAESSTGTSLVETWHDNEKTIDSNAPDVLSGSRKKILQNISVDVPAGSMMAIIGGSGSGKTSLLNVMAYRMGSRNLHCEGSVTFNGNPNINHVRNAYVMQQDVLQPNLTCRETLVYAANLRLPSSTSRQQRADLVEEIILELGLKECANTLVGDTAHKGLSGGEKRRLSIGIQLLANPSVLFLDEPTTGLDANSAFLLVETCKKLVLKGRTIIMSIHQPRSDIFFLFDSVTILTRGQAVYSGSVRDVLPYIEQLGYNFPTHMNPADFLIDLSAIDTRTAEQEVKTKRVVNRLLAAWIANQRFGPVMQPDSVPPSSSAALAKAPLWREIAVLTKRSFIVSMRDPMGLVGLLLECVLMGTICGWIFFKLDGSISGIRSMEGLLYTSCAAQGYLILLYETYRLCGPDLRVFDREYNDGSVGPFGYLISRRLSKMFTEDLYVPLIYSVSNILF
ncbi:hypothetical protein AWJ20_3787 [Sugiyamaella lignohabitans]|uniref:ABC transporter domain-containing protein n=1 Tax=Sugiyamaella lignohabitans TaxID=796027 RepID=A0A167BYR0_9ASCO|nr:uncharacterized protein AWJ20_3787 [Sugiyamaella lignohabitans]ANB10993.1 hypothetical protein AWJ20_3787 [Sugiyamaella lignohabitans]